MSNLSSLDIRAVSPTSDAEAMRLRLLLLRHLRQQMIMWEHDDKGVAYLVMETRYVIGSSGEREARQIKKKPRRWYSASPETQGYYFRCYYRYTPLILLEPNNDVIWCDGFDAIPGTIETLIAAVHAGELDEALTIARTSS